MADNENPRKPYYNRRNPPSRPPPGVQKAMQNFGVKDLREILDKKHQDQGDSQGDKKVEPKQKLPPPDPSYNYLRDPSRDKPKPPPPKKEENKRSQDQHHRHKDPQRQRFKNEQSEISRHSGDREQENYLQNSPTAKDDEAVKKELRFSDVHKVIDEGSQITRGGRSSFRGRNPRKNYDSKPKEDKSEKIENPVNIKIQLSTETGQRSCTLDENTRIAEIKHVPDQISLHRSARGVFRGGRGNFRGKGRGRGSFRGRGGLSNKRGISDNKTVDSEKAHSEKDDNREQNVGETSQAADIKDGAKDLIQTTGEDNEAPLEEYESYEQDNNETDEFEDSHENYEHEDSAEPVPSSEDIHPYESSPGFEENEQKATNSFDSNLTETITITSSKYHDGELKRSVEVKATNGEDTENNSSETKLKKDDNVTD